MLSLNCRVVSFTFELDQVKSIIQNKSNSKLNLLVVGGHQAAITLVRRYFKKSTTRRCPKLVFAIMDVVTMLLYPYCPGWRLSFVAVKNCNFAIAIF